MSVPSRKTEESDQARALGSEYWYPGPTEAQPSSVVQTASKLAWSKALYYATRYHSDKHVAHELMDEAVAEAQRYCDRNPKGKTVKQVWYYIAGRLKRLSMQRSHRRELTAGTLSDLELIPQHSPLRSFEESIFISELLAKMTPRTRQIAQWRHAGYSFRAIARNLHTSHRILIRAYYKELRELVFPGTSSGSPKQNKYDA